MNIIDWLKDLFILDIPTIKEQKVAREKRIRNLFARYSGNVYISRGRYVTKEEIKKRIEKLINYKF